MPLHNERRNGHGFFKVFLSINVSIFYLGFKFIMSKLLFSHYNWSMPFSFELHRLKLTWRIILANIYLFKVNNRSIRKRCEICSKLIIKHQNDGNKETYFKYTSKVYLKRTSSIPAKIHLFKFNNRDTRKRCDTSLKLTIKTPVRSHWRRSSVFIVRFEYISHLLLELLFLNLNK